MASIAEDIETIFVAHAKQIDGIKTVLPYEPNTVDRKQMPMICMFFLLPEGTETATGPTEDVDYRHEVSLYISLTDFQSAQRQMRDLSQLVVANFRHHRADYDLMQDADVFSRRLRRRNPPTPSDDMSYLRGSWELQVTVGEE